MQGYNVRMTARDPLENCNFVPNHVLATLHEFLVDNLASIVFVGLDMNSLLHDSVRPGT